MTEDEVLHLLKKISARWPNFKIDDIEVTVEVYMEDLGAFTYEEVDQAYRSMRGEKWTPTISEIVEILSPAEMGEPWMTRKRGEMGFFEKKQEPDPNEEF
jgi:hypothetical protein